MSDDRTGVTLPRSPQEHLAVLWKRAWIVVGVTLIVTAAGVARSLREPDVYRASSDLVVTTPGNESSALQTQMRVIESAAVHGLAAQKSPGIGAVQTQQNGVGDVITVSADASDPTAAANTVNATVDAYVAYVEQQADTEFRRGSAAIHDRLTQLQRQIDALTARIQSSQQPTAANLSAQLSTLTNEQSALQQRLDSMQLDAATATAINVVSRATPPHAAISPNLRDDVLIALGAGLLLGMALAFLVEYVSETKAKSRARARPGRDLLREVTADVTLMGVIPSGSSRVNEIATLSAPASGAADSYRVLQSAAAFMGLERGRCLEVTSAPEREGKTETLANLGVLLARSGRRVIVVDCDLREPRLHEFFGLSNDRGLTSVVGGASLADALQRIPNVDHLYALTSGPLPDDPSEVLESNRCSDTLASLLVGGTLVLIDTPPLIPSTDACRLVKTVPVDGVVLVATPKSDAREHLRQALELLRESGAPSVGVVLTARDGRVDAQSAQPGRRRWSRRRHSNIDLTDESEEWKGLMRSALDSGRNASSKGNGVVATTTDAGESQRT